MADEFAAKVAAEKQKALEQLGTRTPEQVAAAEAGNAPDPSAQPAGQSPPPDPKAIEAEIDAFFRQEDYRPATATPVSSPTPAQKQEEEEEEDDPVQIARRAAAETYEQMDARRQAKERLEMDGRVMEESARTIFRKYPEILKVDKGELPIEKSPIASEMARILKERPTLKGLPDGHLIAMELAEKKLGIQQSSDAARQEGAMAEKDRQERLQNAAAMSPASGPTGTPKKVAAFDTTTDKGRDEAYAARKLGMSAEDWNKYGSKRSHIGDDYYSRHRIVKPARRGRGQP